MTSKAALGIPRHSSSAQSYCLPLQPYPGRIEELWKFPRREGNCSGNNLKGFYCSTDKLGRRAAGSLHVPESSNLWADFSTMGLTPFSPAGPAMSRRRDDGKTSPWQRVRRRRTGDQFFSPQIRPAWRCLRNSAQCFRQCPTSPPRQPGSGWM